MIAIILLVLFLAWLAGLIYFYTKAIDLGADEDNWGMGEDKYSQLDDIILAKHHKKRDETLDRS